MSATITINVPVVYCTVYGLGRNDFDVGKATSKTI
jgi:hypothetical protein